MSHVRKGASAKTKRIQDAAARRPEEIKRYRNRHPFTDPNEKPEITALDIHRALAALIVIEFKN